MPARICASILLTLVLASAAEARKWTSRDGNFTVEAELVKVVDDIVHLKKADGTLLTVPLNRFSGADREYLAGPAKKDNVRIKLAEQQAKSALEQEGIRVVSSGLAMAEEADLSRGLRDITRIRRAMFHANRDLLKAQSGESQKQAAISALTKLNIRLNGQLANLGPNDILQNNKLVGAINGNNSKIQLLHEQLTKAREHVADMRAKANEAREAYIQQILDLRAVADGLQDRLREVSAQEGLRAAVEQLNEATGKSYQLGASRGFRSSLNRLERLEETVLSETIVLRRDSGVPYASVVVNGKHTQDMVVDSGSSLISLPERIAKECGIEVHASDPTIVLELADGSQVEGKLVKADFVRVGKFTIENVECAVLGPDAPNAVPLLGMSFLGHFKFELNPQQSALTLVKVDDG